MGRRLTGLEGRKTLEAWKEEDRKKEGIILAGWKEGRKEGRKEERGKNEGR